LNYLHDARCRQNRFLAVVFAGLGSLEPCYAEDIVRDVSTAFALEEMRNGTELLPATVGRIYRIARLPAPLDLKYLTNSSYFDELMSRRSKADANLRALGWSAAPLMAEWDESWKILPGGVRADEAPLTVAIKHAFEACADAVDEAPGQPMEEEICGPKILDGRLADVKRASIAQEACIRNWGFDLDSACMYALSAADYENESFDPTRAPLSIQNGALRKRTPTQADLDQLGAALTGILELIRKSLPADPDAPCEQTPVRIVIDATRTEAGLNVTASYCASELRVPLRIVEDIWARSLFRATQYYRAVYSPIFEDALGDALSAQGQPLQLAMAAGTPEFEQVVVTGSRVPGPKSSIRQYAEEDLRAAGLYSANAQNYIDLLTGLPAIKYKMVFAGDLAREMRATGDPALLEKWSFELRQMAAAPDRTIFDLDFDLGQFEEICADLRQSRPERARDRSLSRYLAWINSLNAGDEDALFHQLERNLVLLSELSLISQMAHAEQFKSYMFILAHESWHIWKSDQGRIVLTKPPGVVLKDAWNQDELNADKHGAAIFLAALKQPDVKRYFEAIAEMDTNRSLRDFGEGDGTDRRDPLKELATAFLGRDPDAILYEIYHGTQYEEGLGHPPVTDRVAAIRQLIDEGRGDLTNTAIENARCVLAAGFDERACTTEPAWTSETEETFDEEP